MHRRSGRLAEEESFGPFDPDRVAAEPFPKRVRARLDGRWVLDTDRALIAWIEGPTPDYAIAREDVDAELHVGETRSHERLGEVGDVTLSTPETKVEGAGVLVQNPPSDVQRLEGHVVFDWDALGTWFVEDERQRGHPRDPYHRIDVHESSRHVEVDVGGETVAESSRPLAVFETRLPFRFYLPEVDVRTDLLVESDTETVCAYKGEAVHFHAEVGGEVFEDVAWTYPSPEPEMGRLQDKICFYQERVRMLVEETELV